MLFSYFLFSSFTTAVQLYVASGIKRVHTSFARAIKRTNVHDLSCGPRSFFFVRLFLGYVRPCRFLLCVYRGKQKSTLMRRESTVNV